MNGLKSMDVRHVKGFLCRKGKLQILSNTQLKPQSNTQSNTHINLLTDTADPICMQYYPIFTMLTDSSAAIGLENAPNGTLFRE
ncbi:hypothetical protein BSK54_18990 [Paenibacillus odorifer]|nr:hypothetical protein BSK54_18990 [Paenibacillus odorifer]